jgi:hypothetical protein
LRSSATWNDFRDKDAVVAFDVLVANAASDREPESGFVLLELDGYQLGCSFVDGGAGTREDVFRRRLQPLRLRQQS